MITAIYCNVCNDMLAWCIYPVNNLTRGDCWLMNFYIERKKN